MRRIIGKEDYVLSEVIKFDFIKAESLSTLVNECKRTTDGTSSKLKKEMGNMGTWWKGKSYDELKNLFDDHNGVNSALHELLDETVRVGNVLAKIVNSKMDLDNKKLFI